MIRRLDVQTYLFLEKCSLGRQISLLNDNRVRRDLGSQRHRIAPAARPNRLRIHRRRAIFANDPGESLIETHGSANLTGVEDGSNLAIRFLVKPETNLNPVLDRRITMEITIRNLC